MIQVVIIVQNRHLPRVRVGLSGEFEQLFADNPPIPCPIASSGYNTE